MKRAGPSTPRSPALPAPAESGSAAPTGRFGVRALRQSTEAALDSISEGFIILDREWRFVFANPAAERYMQKSRADVMGITLWAAFPDAANRRFGREYRRAIAERVPVEFEEFYPEPLNAWFEVRAYPSPEGLSVFFRDVTERRRTEDALRQSEERYRALFNAMDQGFALFEVVCDENGAPSESRFLDVNRAFARMTGLTREDVVGKSGKHVFPADHAQWAEVYRSVPRTGQPIAVDHTSLDTGRQYEVFAFQPASGQFAVLFHDVTEHKKLAEELRVNLTKYKVLFDAIPLGISVTDAEGQVREINPIASRVLGANPESVLGQRIGRPEWRILRPDGSRMPPEELASVRAMKETRAVEHVETGIARPGEDVLWLDVSAAPIPLDGYGVVITYGDITRRKKAEEALAEAHREALAARSRLEAVMEALPVGVAIVDARGGIRASNAAYEQIWNSGRTPATSLAAHHGFRARWADSGRAVSPEEWASSRALGSGAPVVGQLLEIERADGSRTFVLNSAAPFFDQGGAIAGCAVAVQDISRLVDAERSLVRTQEDLREANVHLEVANSALQRSNRTLEARVDARTRDLTRRTAQLQALALDLTRAEERERQRAAEIIHDQLQQLLALARIRLGIVLERITARPVRKSLTDLDRLLTESLEITRSLTAELSPAILRRSGLAAALRWLGRWYHDRFGLEVAVEIDAEGEADDETRVMLFRAARELLFNVVKHARAPNAAVRLSRTSDGRARIAVSDKGEGFDPEMLRAGDGTGEGFGLFSLRERLELLGGQFDVESAPGRGTSITISGPAPRPVTPEAPPPAVAPSTIAPRRRAGGRSRRAPSRKKS